MTVNYLWNEWNSALFKILKVETMKTSRDQIFAINVKENTIIEIFRNMSQLSIYQYSKLMKDKNSILLLDISHMLSKDERAWKKNRTYKTPMRFSLNFLSTDLIRKDYLKRKYNNKYLERKS